jgi:hypothetical protein
MCRELYTFRLDTICHAAALLLFRKSFFCLETPLFAFGSLTICFLTEKNMCSSLHAWACFEELWRVLSLRFGVKFGLSTVKCDPL